MEESIIHKSKNDIAKEVINGKWGFGLERKRKLESAGYDYDDVQYRVNQIIQLEYLKQEIDGIRSDVRSSRFSLISSIIIAGVIYTYCIYQAKSFSGLLSVIIFLACFIIMVYTCLSVVEHFMGSFMSNKTKLNETEKKIKELEKIINEED